LLANVNHPQDLSPLGHESSKLVGRSET
jgi:hypothetical protein